MIDFGLQLSTYDDPVLDFDTVEICSESERMGRLVHESCTQVGRGFLLEFRNADVACDGAVVPERADLCRNIPLKLGADVVEIELLHGRGTEPAAHGAPDGKCSGEVQFCGEFAVDGMAEVAVMLVTHSGTDHDLIEDTEIVHEHLRVRVEGEGVS